jgi:hypothetical protein
MTAFLRTTLVLFAALLLGACATPGYGDRYGGNPYGSDPYGGGYGYPDSTYPQGGYGSGYGSQRFIATVDGIDARSGRVLLVVSDARGYGSQRLEVFFDNSTRLYYQGRQYPVTGLERGGRGAVERAPVGEADRGGAERPGFRGIPVLSDVKRPA